MSAAVAPTVPLCAGTLCQPMLQSQPSVATSAAYVPGVAARRRPINAALAEPITSNARGSAKVAAWAAYAGSPAASLDATELASGPPAVMQEGRRSADLSARHALSDRHDAADTQGSQSACGDGQLGFHGGMGGAGSDDSFSSSVLPFCSRGARTKGGVCAEPDGCGCGKAASADDAGGSAAVACRSAAAPQALKARTAAAPRSGGECAVAARRPRHYGLPPGILQSAAGWFDGALFGDDEGSVDESDEPVDDTTSTDSDASSPAALRKRDKVCDRARAKASKLRKRCAKTAPGSSSAAATGSAPTLAAGSSSAAATAALLSKISSALVDGCPSSDCDLDEIADTLLFACICEDGPCAEHADDKACRTRAARVAAALADEDGRSNASALQLVDAAEEDGELEVAPPATHAICSACGKKISLNKDSTLHHHLAPASLGASSATSRAACKGKPLPLPPADAAASVAAPAPKPKKVPASSARAAHGALRDAGAGSHPGSQGAYELSVFPSDDNLPAKMPLKDFAA